MGAIIKKNSLLRYNTIVRNPKYYIDLITVLTQKELKVRYKRSFLGYLWSIANPLALALVFFVAFKVIMRIQIENYTLFLISGLFPWQWFSNSVNSSVMVFVNNASILKKVNFGRETLVIATVMNDMFHFIVSIPVIGVFVIFYGLTPHISWLYGIPLLILTQFLITLGMSLAFSSINLFFRDLERLVAIFTTLLFYFTPIFYSEEMIPQKLRFLLMLNPLSGLTISWRNLFMKGVVNPSDILISFAHSLIIMAIGYIVFKRLSWRFAEVL